MGKLSRMKMLGMNYRDRIRGRVGEVLGSAWHKHINQIYPYYEEDSEGIITWESPRRCRMQFKSISVNDGYNKTVKKYTRVHLINYVNISIDDKYVVVQF